MSPRRLARPVLIAVLSLGGAPAPSPAELLEFVEGGKVVLPATIDGDEVVVEGPNGPKRFLRSDFRTIAPSPDPSAEWPGRRDRARDGDIGERFAAAWWALENGLTAECASLLREIHAADPDHQPTARLVATLDRLAPPCPDPSLDRLAALKAPGMRADRSDHVLLFHRLEPAEAATRLELLERVLTAYYLSLTAYGLALDAPRERLVFFWYPDPASYRSALAATGAGGLRATKGCFHPTLSVVMTYDGRSEPARRREQQAIDAARSAPRDDAARRELDRRQLLLDLDRIGAESSLAAHELIHALARSSGLAPRHETFPVWLHEGLAMQYEVVRGGRWAGVGRLNPLRLPYWNRSAPDVPLGRILRDHGHGRGYDPAAYARSWALVYYLRKRHPDAFVALLDGLRSPLHPDRSPGERSVELFRTLFGDDHEHFESDWRRYIDALELDTDVR